MEAMKMSDSLVALGASAGNATVGVVAVEGVPHIVPDQPVLQVLVQLIIAVSALWPSIKGLFKKKTT